MVRILHLKTGQTAPFKAIFDYLKEILPEANMEFRPRIKDVKDREKRSGSADEEAVQVTKKPSAGGIRIMAVDLTKTVLIYVKLDAAEFSEFEVRKNKYVIGVNMGMFYKLIKSVEKDESLTLYVDSEDVNNLNINIESNRGTSTDVQMKLMDLDEERLDIPPTDFQARIIMRAQHFSRICKEMHGIADLMEIKCTPKQITFNSRGEGASRWTRLKMPDLDADSDEEDEECSVIIDFAQPEKGSIVQGVFELKHLSWFSKCANFCNDIEIYMKNDYALVIKYTVASLGRILLCLSPIKYKKTDSAIDDFEDDDDLYAEEKVRMK